ncbi:MAG: hypothetical protein P9L94_20125 [Candidatus Hinthialibacter antarcticus]|nr:hypothetical protein [Candidatus Hinthialibacter antarcticus]
METLKNTLATGAAVVAASMLSKTANAAEGFIGRIQSNDENVRCEAWKEAYMQPASVISPLSDLLLAENPGIARAADEALKVLIHSVGEQADSPKRAEVVKSLLDLLNRRDYVTRINGLRLLSLVANGDSVAAVTPFLKVPQLQEEAIYCIQRIPGAESTDALVEALAQAPREFKLRILAAIEQRKDPAGAENLNPYLASDDTELAIAAIKAMATCGVYPDESLVPDYETLSDQHKRELVDSGLRICDHLIADGSYEQAGRILKRVLEIPEEEIGEHFHCAAILCLAKVDHPEAKSSVQKFTEQGSYIVRDTAKKALAAM